MLIKAAFPLLFSGVNSGCYAVIMREQNLAGNVYIYIEIMLYCLTVLRNKT